MVAGSILHVLHRLGPFFLRRPAEKGNLWRRMETDLSFRNIASG